MCLVCGQHGQVPVIRMVVVTENVARMSPRAVAELYRLLEGSKQAAGHIDTAPWLTGLASNC